MNRNRVNRGEGKWITLEHVSRTFDEGKGNLDKLLTLNDEVWHDDKNWVSYSILGAKLLLKRLKTKAEDEQYISSFCLFWSF